MKILVQIFKTLFETIVLGDRPICDRQTDGRACRNT